MGDKITALPEATTVDGTEVVPIVQNGTTKQVPGSIIRRPFGAANGDLAGSYPNPTLAVITTAQTSVGNASLIPVVSIDAKGRVTALSTAPNTMGTVTSVAAGTGLSGGPITSTGSLSVEYGTTAGTAAQGNDSRFDTIPSASTLNPSPDSTSPVIGVSEDFARADHSHPKAVTSITGDIVGSGAETIVAQLASITSAQSNVGGITQIPQISIDAKGRVTSLTTVSNPQTAITSLSGDVITTGSGAAAAQLSESGVVAGSYGYATTGMVPTITVDAKGRITAASQAALTLQSDRTSTSSHSLQYGSKDFSFTPNGVIPYVAGQWITIRSVSDSSKWISGTVSICSLSLVRISTFQSSDPTSSALYNSWNIAVGQAINYFGTATNGSVLQYTSSTGRWSPATLDTGNATKLQGVNVNSQAPNPGEGLVYDSSTSSWKPTPGGSSNATQIQGVGVSSTPPNSGEALVYTGAVWQAGAPNGNAVKIQGRDLTDAVPDNKMCLAWVASNNQWQPSFPESADAVKLQSRNVADTLPTDGQVLSWDDAVSQWKPVDAVAGGSNATQLQGNAIADAVPNALEVLTWAQISTGGGDYEWRPRPLGGNTAPTAGQGLVYNVDNGWVAGDVNAFKIRNQTVVTTSPNTNEALVYNGNDWAPAAVNAVQLQGQTISSSAPSTGNLLRFDGTSWSPFDGLVIPGWNSTTPYAAGDFVYYQNQFWVSQSFNTGYAPTFSSPNGSWVPITGAGATASAPNDSVNVAGWIATVIGGTVARIPYYV